MKKILLMLAFALVALAGCKKDPAPEAGKVSQIKLVGMPTTEFTVGRSVTISAVITPDDATDKSVTFTSSNPEVATVEYTESENNYSLALLKAVGPGKATITATANDGSGVKAEAEVEVTEIPKMTFTSPANCYIVTAADTYAFKAVKGNSSESVGNVASAEVLWETFGTDVTPAVGKLVKDVSYSNGEITFKATDKKGNAVIAAKDADGNILWSWHIWLTDQPQEQKYYNNAGTMMDRNLGATSATPGDVGALGLLYQWGRKDPFLGSSSISSGPIAESTITWPSAVSSDSSNGTIAYAIANPTTFITKNSKNLDWHYTGSESTDNTRWTTSESNKSIYDPCPAGWRVPDGGENGVWSRALGSSSDFKNVFDNIDKGMNFSDKFGSASTIWYPAPGSRADFDGRLFNVAYYGIYWSASPDDQYVNILCFYNNGTVESLNTNRASGYSVRCVKE
jgi:uncharacterized protein (TIGR02145 family)